MAEYVAEGTRTLKEIMDFGDSVTVLKEEMVMPWNRDSGAVFCEAGLGWAEAVMTTTE